jgi:hypothetical protein
MAGLVARVLVLVVLVTACFSGRGSLESFAADEVVVATESLESFESFESFTSFEFLDSGKTIAGTSGTNKAG